MRIKLAAALVGLLAVGGTAIDVTGGAHAQPGSRLCGVIYTAKTTKEVVAKIYEYPQSDKVVCFSPTDEKQNPAWDQSFVKEKDPNQWDSKSFRNEICENFPKDYMGGKDFQRVGGGWPSWEDHNDICNNMNRSDTAFELERYLGYDSDSATTKAWDFMRQ